MDTDSIDRNDASPFGVRACHARYAHRRSSNRARLGNKMEREEVSKMAKATVTLGKEEVQVQITPKEFKSGKEGFWGQAKVEDSGKRYQVQIMAVELE